MINYKDIPDGWPVCPNENCPMAQDCLRHQACRQMPATVTKWNCILPSALSDGQCKYFRKYEKVTMAKGIAAIYKNVSNRYARTSIRVELTSFLGSKGTYYRYKDGERLINPQLQAEIRDIVHRHAPGVEVSFDETFETYDFTRL